MIKTCDRVFTSQVVANVLARISERLGSPLPDDAVDDLLVREELTIFDIGEMLDRHTAQTRSGPSNVMVLAVLQDLYPALDDQPELHMPLLKALKICPDYAASYR